MDLNMTDESKSVETQFVKTQMSWAKYKEEAIEKMRDKWQSYYVLIRDGSLTSAFSFDNEAMAVSLAEKISQLESDKRFVRNPITGCGNLNDRAEYFDYESIFRQPTYCDVVFRKGTEIYIFSTNDEEIAGRVCGEIRRILCSDDGK